MGSGCENLATASWVLATCSGVFPHRNAVSQGRPRGSSPQDVLNHLVFLPEYEQNPDRDVCDSRLTMACNPVVHTLAKATPQSRASVLIVLWS